MIIFATFEALVKMICSISNINIFFLHKTLIPIAFNATLNRVRYTIYVTGTFSLACEIRHLIIHINKLPTQGAIVLATSAVIT